MSLVRVPVAPTFSRPVSPIASQPARARRRLSETDVGARLLRRLDAVTAHPTEHSFAAVRASVTELVDRMRTLDLPLERVVAAVDTLLREHGVHQQTLVLHADEPSRSTCAEPVTRRRLVEWCARAYESAEWW